MFHISSSQHLHKDPSHENWVIVDDDAFENLVV